MSFQAGMSVTSLINLFSYFITPVHHVQLELSFLEFKILVSYPVRTEIRLLYSSFQQCFMQKKIVISSVYYFSDLRTLLCSGTFLQNMFGGHIGHITLTSSGLSLRLHFPWIGVFMMGCRQTSLLLSPSEMKNTFLSLWPYFQELPQFPS